MVSNFVNVSIFLPYSNDFFQIVYCLDLELISVLERYTICETNLRYRQKQNKPWTKTKIIGDQTLAIIMGRPKKLKTHTSIVTTIDGIELQYGLYPKRLEEGKNNSRILINEANEAGRVIYYQNRTIVPGDTF